VGSRAIAPRILNLPGQFHSPVASGRHPLNRKQAGPHNRAIRFGRTEKCLVFTPSLITNFGPGGSVGIATMGSTVRDRIPVGTRFSARPDRPWGPSSLLYNGYRVFPRGKVRPGRAADHSPPSSAAFMEEYGYTSTHPLGHTGPVMGSLYLYLVTIPTELSQIQRIPKARDDRKIANPVLYRPQCILDTCSNKPKKFYPGRLQQLSTVSVRSKYTGYCTNQTQSQSVSYCCRFRVLILLVATFHLNCYRLMCQLIYPTDFVGPNHRIRFKKFQFGILEAANRLCLLSINHFTAVHYVQCYITVHRLLHQPDSFRTKQSSVQCFLDTHKNAALFPYPEFRPFVLLKTAGLRR